MPPVVPLGADGVSPSLMAGPEKVVNPPTLRPEPCGLLQALQVIDGDDRIIGGIRHRPENAARILGLDPCANTVVAPAYTGLPPRIGRAFVAQEIDECGSFGWETNEYQDRATRGLLAKESIFVEAELERAVTVPENPHLSAPGSFAPADVAVGAGGNIFTSAGAGFRQYMEGWTVSGPYWAPPVSIDQVLSDTQVAVNGLAHKSVSLTTTAAGTAVVATAGTFDTVRDVGATAADNPNIPAGVTISAVTDATHATLSSGVGVTAATGVPTTITPVLAMSGLTVTFADPGFVLCAAGAAVSPVEGLAYLNSAIADAEIGLGLIHLPAFVGERALQGRAIVTPGATSPSLYYSVNGNPIVLGNGYQGVGPDGTGGSPTTVAPASTVYQWAYATDLIQVYRSAAPAVYPPTLREALDRQANLIAYRASRPYALNWSGILRAAVKIAVTTGEPT